MATSRPKKNSIVAIDDKEKKIIVYGDLTNPKFQALIKLSKPDGYIVELWKAPRSEKQKASAEELKKKGDEYYFSILSDDEKEIYKAIKGAYWKTLPNGKVLNHNFAHARKWVEDGKKLDNDGNPIIYEYKSKGTGKNRVKEIVGTITIKIK